MDYEPSTVEQTPERVEDLFKRLYQNLVPREIRHSLGEYFTPDWLAELTLEEAGYDGNPDMRVLDPACGSGTFLVLAIKRAREWALEHWGVSADAQTELLEKITKNIVGIDLNPLAVLASKANYLIALGKLIRYRTGDVTIPVYLADSITVSTKTSARGGKRIALKTVAGEFEVPLEIIENGLVDKVFEAIEDGLRRNYSPGKFVAYLYTYKLKGRKFSQDTEDALKELYKKLYQLEQEGKDRIWTRVLRNAFAPLTLGKFDLVVGNPPWINWESLPESYRELTKPLWQYYGLEKGSGKGMGRVKRDMAMLFVARTFDRYLKPGGRLAFLVPFTLFKTQAGAGFRKFLTYGRRREPKIPVKLLRVHDLVTLYPFEGATTRTGLLVIEKTEKTEFPVPLIVWNWPDSKGADVEATLEDVRKKAKIHQLVFIPIEEGKPESPWMMTTEKAYEGIKKALGSSEYRAYEGVLTALNGVYWVRILQDVGGGKVLIENLWDVGKKKVKKVRRIVEKDLLYPLVRGRDHNRWHVEDSGIYILVLHDPETGKPLLEEKLQVDYPLTYEYLVDFKKELEIRSIHKLWGKGNPFYSVYDIGEYTFRPYKVVWKYVAGKISGKAEFSTAVMAYKDDEYLGQKMMIPNEKIMLVPLENENEAHYLSAVLNSTITQLIVASYTIETQISTHVLNNVKVPTFDPSTPTHIELAELSKKAHEVAREKYKLLDELKVLKASLKGKRGKEREAIKAKIEELNEKIAETEEKLRKIEAEIDRKVAELYGITKEELKEIERLYEVLME
nr:N-6 DNA methylase [Thermococcus sp. 9N3]